MSQSNSLSTADADATSAALEALNKMKQEKEAEKVLSGEDITSLNKLLQWSTAHSDNPTSLNNEGRQKAVEKTQDQLDKDRAWLDQAFPDPFAEINELIRILREDTPSQRATVQILEGIQEYFMDLNFAINIDKMGALEPVLNLTAAESSEVRAAAFWVIGSAMRDLQEVKELVMERDGHKALAEGLKDETGAVRAKAVMASSALLRHSSPAVQNKFKEAGGTASLLALLSDENSQVRRRARFFLQHARETGNPGFVRDLLDDQSCVASLSASIEELDVDDVADVEAAVGALGVLIETDKMGLLRLAPELPDVIDSLVSKCSDHDLRDLLRELASQMD